MTKTTAKVIWQKATYHSANSCFVDIFYHIVNCQAARVAKLDVGTFGTPFWEGEVVEISDCTIRKRAGGFLKGL